MRRTVVIGMAGMVVVAGGLSIARAQAHRVEQARRSSLVQRGPVSPEHRPGVERGEAVARSGGLPQYPLAFRTIDGSGNNVGHPDWGASATPMRRVMGADYADGVSAPAGPSRPSPRLISNTVAAQSSSLPNSAGASDYLWQWGQFLDHDVVETPVAVPSEHFDIAVPTGDPYFDPAHTGTVTIGLDRSGYTMVAGVRQQKNNITAFIDASNVYGSDSARASELRTLDGTGRLKTSAGDLLPFNTGGFPNAPTALDPTLYLAGDIRCNEQIALTAMHTLFVREHNYWADSIHAAEPLLDDEGVYQRARAIVAAEMQVITYNEFLPLLIGPGELSTSAAYDPDLEPTIDNAFAAAAFRVGHTLLSPTLRRVNADGTEAPEGHIALANAFFSPTQIGTHGIDSILRGLAFQRAQEIDPFVIDDVRNFLFGPPGAGGFDLASLNIQRGRDHGLPCYNDIRVAFGLPPAATFDDVNPEPIVSGRLAAVYNTPSDIDAWVGLLAEPHASGAMVGETLKRVLIEQFTCLRDGDAFWYQGYLTPALVSTVESTTLADIIRRNTGIGNEIGDNAFLVAGGCSADIDNNGVVGLSDLQLLLFDFGNAGPAAPGDTDGDGDCDLQDLQQLLFSFGLVCP